MVSMSLFALLIPSLSFSQSKEKNIVPNTVIVKFTSDALRIKELREGNTNSLPQELQSLLGIYTLTPYIENALIQGVRQHFAGRDGEELIGINLAESIERIMVIRYSTNLAPQYVARKISSLRGVAYAEPMPHHTIVFTPNDPLVSQQYHLNLIRALDAWDIASSTANIAVGVIDSGFDYTHQDLSANAFTNAGETGTDTQGRDKRTNGVDDDNNGFVDDWRGWDFIGASTSSPTPDNDPRPGNPHGTHVAGILGAVINNGIGIAGVARSVRIMGMKCGSDPVNDRDIFFGFNAILYAATMRMAVINCSWGSSTYARSEQEIISTATRMGSLVICAAGNDNTDAPFYPAMYEGAMSITSLTSADEKSSFSNFNVAAKLAMPGSSIFSTYPNNQYQFLSGTSMASPVAAGLAAMVRARFPNYTPAQVIAHLQATADPIYTIGINPGFVDRLGAGRGNALRALSTPTANLKRMSVVKYRVVDAGGDGILDPGERAQIFLTVRNQLSAVNAARAVIESPFSIAVAPSQTTPTTIGDFAANEEREITTSFGITISSSAPENGSIQVVVRFTDASGSVGSDALILPVNPTFRTLDSNNITVTINSEANIGFNDFPDNLQGEGFSYRKGDNLLYEGALIVGTTADTLSDNARSSGGATRNTDFKKTSVIRLQSPGTQAVLESTANFSDQNATGRAGVSVKQSSYQFTQANVNDCIFMNYAITNTSGRNRSRMFAGLYFDWDLGPLGAFNQAFYDSTAQMGVMQNVRDTAMPWIGSILITPQRINFRAIDNAGGIGDNFGVYNGFTREEKILALTNGISRARSSVGDDSYMISGGPFAFPRDTTVNVNFVLLVGKNLADLRTKAQLAREFASRNGLDGVIRPRETFFTISPNPVDNGGRLSVEFVLPAQETSAELTVYNLLGERIAIISEGVFDAGINRLNLDTQSFASGVYILVFRGQTGTFSVKFIVDR